MTRRLLYVPIIHTEADLGSVGKDSQQEAERIGETLWKRHEETVLGFWDEIAGHFIPFTERVSRYTEDGTGAGGETAMTIVQDVLHTGSRNYQIISELIRKGAVLVKMEDLNLVRRSATGSSDNAGKEPDAKSLPWPLKY